MATIAMLSLVLTQARDDELGPDSVRPSWHSRRAFGALEGVRR